MKSTILSTKKHNYPLYLLLGAALLLRLICAYTYRGFETDTACFYNWALRLWEKGPANFYAPDYFCDYPPGYLYILNLLGGVLAAFGINTMSGFCMMLLKLPAILADIVAGILIYRYAKKSMRPHTALFLSAIYLFHPAVFINSALWGQVDAVFTLFLLLTCILLTEKKAIPAYFLFALCILLKPQSLVFAPLILCNLWENILSQRPVRELLFKLLGGLGAICTLVLLSLPFGLDKVFSQYTSTLASYPYAAINAFNLWGLFGKNWISQDTTLGFLTYGQLGTVFLVLITLASFCLFYIRKDQKDRYYLTGAFLICSVFIFAVRMHERYLFPVMLLLLFTYISNRQKGFLQSFTLLSTVHFGNVFWVLFFYDPSNYNRTAFIILLLSFLTVASGFIFYYYIFLASRKKALKALPHPSETSNTISLKVQEADILDDLGKYFSCFFKEKAPVQSRGKLTLTKTDWFFLIALPCFYAFFAFYNLGITKAPTSELYFPYNTYLELDATEQQSITNIYWYLGNEQDINCKLEIKQTPDAPWTYVQDFKLADVFEWETFALTTPATSIRITNLTEDAFIGELLFTDASGNHIDVMQKDAYYPLFDEAHTFPEEINAQSTTIFDEIYYTRTVHEFRNGLPTYENTHPPLGKVLITLGTLFFGTTPFGFRFMGALFGVLMLPFLYLFARNITASRAIGGFVNFLFAFDFMHFTQTRIATIDVFVTFFIIVMYYFMEQYCNMNFYDTNLRKTFLPLGACGIAFGLGIAAKWTGFYAGAGLAILFFLQLFKRYQEYQYALRHPKDSTAGISHAFIIRNFKMYAWKTIGFCMIFFVLIPGCIYLLSYIPFVDPSHPGLFARMLANQQNMFQYHSTLEATHAYSSLWYEWPTMVRPILYYTNTVSEELRQGISAFGNPLVWWAGIPAFLYTGYLALRCKDSHARFLCISYLAQYLPWVLISRCTFIYHYFPSVPFVALMIGYCFLSLKKRLPVKAFLCTLLVYAAGAFLLFTMFYPVLSGTTVSRQYVDQLLRWLDGWVLII